MKRKEEEEPTRELTELEREQLNREQESNLIMDSFGVSDPKPVVQSGLDLGSPKTKQDFIDLSTKLVGKFKKLEVR